MFLSACNWLKWRSSALQRFAVWIYIRLHCLYISKASCLSFSSCQLPLLKHQTCIHNLSTGSVWSASHQVRHIERAPGDESFVSINRDIFPQSNSVTPYFNKSINVSVDTYNSKTLNSAHRTFSDHQAWNNFKTLVPDSIKQWKLGQTKGQGGWGRMVMRWSYRWGRAKRRSASISYWWKVKGSQSTHADSERQVITWKRASLLTQKGFRTHLCHSWQKQRAFSIFRPRRKVSLMLEAGLAIFNACVSLNARLMSCFYLWKCTLAPKGVGLNLTLVGT